MTDTIKSALLAAAAALSPANNREEREAAALIDTALAELTGAPATLDAMNPALRGQLLERGLTPETIGGGATALTFYTDDGWQVMVTQAEGGGLPMPESWHVGLYSPEERGDAAWQASSLDGAGVRFRLGDALDMAFKYARDDEARVADGVAPPNAAAIICDGIVLLDTVSSAWADEDGKSGRFITADGFAFRFTVEQEIG